MEKDLILKLIQTAKFIWREAKKPILRMRIAGKMTLLPSRASEEMGQPKASCKAAFDLTLVYLLLGLLAVRCICRAISAIFRW
ncbi:MAG: hypothetical protein IJZ89_08180 [Clostridia bacterium]|nr:hypothetical protein [Clostridia bacterium]